MLRTMLIAGLCVCAAGCIQRQIRIHSEPAGALVYLNDVEVGRTPTTVPFTFYGTYDVRLEKPGYQTLNTAQKAKAPWYDNPGPDLVTELAPWRTNVQLEWFFTLEPAGPVDEALTVDRGRQLRAMMKAELDGDGQAEAPTDAQPIDAPADEAADAPAQAPADGETE